MYPPLWNSGTGVRIHRWWNWCSHPPLVELVFAFVAGGIGARTRKVAVPLIQAVFAVLAVLAILAVTVADANLLTQNAPAAVALEWIKTAALVGKLFRFVARLSSQSLMPLQRFSTLTLT
jgi:hypothetical protein